MKEYGAKLILNAQKFQKGIQTSTKMMSNFKKDVKKAQEEIKRLDKEKATIKISADKKKFSKTIKSVKKTLKPLRKTIVQSIAVRDLASKKTRKLQYKLNKLGRTVTRPIIKVKDKATKFLMGLKRKLFNLKNTVVAIGVTFFMKKTLDEVMATQTAQGEVKSLGLSDSGIEQLTKKAIEFSNTWSGTVRSDFIKSAYDIKSGIVSLTDEGVAQFTELSGLTAKATKSTTEEMTTLFAQAYSIYSKSFDNDFDFGQNFASGLAKSVQQFRTTGSEMQQYLTTLGSEAQMAGADLSEVFAIGGSLQSIMSGSEAGTKYTSFLQGAVKASGKLKLKFTDSNNQLLSSVEIIEKIKGKYGETLDAVEAQQLKEAFGRKEATAFIKYYYNKTDDLRKAQESVNNAMGGGLNNLKTMANVMNVGLGEKVVVLKQRWKNLQYSFGKKITPAISPALDSLSNKLKDLQTSKSFEKFATSVSKGLSKALDNVQKFVEYLVNNPQAISEAWEGIKTVMQSLGAIINVAYQLAKPFLDYIKKNPDKAVKFAKGIFKLWVAFKGVSMAVGGVFKLIDSINFLRSVFPILKTGASLFSGVLLGAIKSLVAGATGVLAPFFAFLMANPIILVITAIIGVVVLLYKAWKNNWGGMRDIVSNVWDNIVLMTAKGVELLVTGINKVIKLINKIPGVDIGTIDNPDWVDRAVTKAQDRATQDFETQEMNNIKGGKGTSNSADNSPIYAKNRYAFGMRRVPRNDFPALLHEGERVLTKQEAKQSTKVNIEKLADSLVVREEADIDKIAEALARKLEEASINIA